MFKYTLLFFLFLFSFQLSEAQSIKRALTFLEKKEYERILGNFDKAIEKDSLNPAGYYMLTLVYLENDFPKKSLDSAYTYIQKALFNYGIIETKEKERLSKNDFNEQLILNQRERIDSLIFNRTVAQNTEIDFNYFIKTHPQAKQMDQAITIRNRLAFDNATKINSYESYRLFMETYPQADQVTEARNRYNVLLFNEKTKDKTLLSYQTFLKKYPETPFRKTLEKNILEMLTASNQEQQYLNFLTTYPTSIYSKKAYDLLYYSVINQGTSQASFIKKYEKLKFTDSISQRSGYKKQFYFPTLDSNNGYSFININGSNSFSTLATVDKRYLCHGVNDETIYAYDDSVGHILDTNGKSIASFVFERAESLENGLIQTNLNGKKGLVHNSGWKLLENIFDELEANEHFIIAKIGSKFGLYAYNGLQIFDHEYEDITVDGSFVMLSKNDKIAITNIAEVTDFVQKGNISLDFEYDDFHAIDQNNLIAIRENKEELLNNRLEVLIPLGNHRITKKNWGWTTTGNNNFTYYNSSYRIVLQKEYKNIQSKYQWDAIKYDDQWNLILESNKSIEEIPFDSLSILNKYAVYTKTGDKESLLFNNRKSITINKGQNFKFYQSNLVRTINKTVVPWYVVINDNKSTTQSIFDVEATKKFTLKNNKLSIVFDSLFVVERNNKKGIVNIAGETILPSRLSAVGKNDSLSFSLLSGSKFGLLIVASKQYINPTYDKPLIPFNDVLFIATKKGMKGIVDVNNKTITGFDYQEIVSWNDSVALVQKDGIWRSLNVITGKINSNQFLQFEIHPGNKGKRAIIYGDKGYGVIDESGDVIINAGFNDIKVIGNSDKWIYFCEKYIKEAELFVVIYYNQDGKKLLHKVYIESDYDRIYCDN